MIFFPHCMRADAKKLNVLILSGEELCNSPCCLFDNMMIFRCNFSHEIMIKYLWLRQCWNQNIMISLYQKEQRWLKIEISYLCIQLYILTGQITGLLLQMFDFSEENKPRSCLPKRPCPLMLSWIMTMKNTSQTITDRGCMNETIANWTDINHFAMPLSFLAWRVFIWKYDPPKEPLNPIFLDTNEKDDCTQVQIKFELSWN